MQRRLALVLGFAWTALSCSNHPPPHDDPPIVATKLDCQAQRPKIENAFRTPGAAAEGREPEAMADMLIADCGRGGKEVNSCLNEAKTARDMEACLTPLDDMGMAEEAIFAGP